METHPDVELNCAPQYQHGRVPIAISHPIDLCEAEDRADRGEQPQKKQTNHSCLLCCLDIQLEQQWNGKDNDGDVANDGEDG